MSEGDMTPQVSHEIDPDADGSTLSSSISVFIRSSIPPASSSQAKEQHVSTAPENFLTNMQSNNDQSLSKFPSHVRDLEHKLNNLQKIVFDLSHQIRFLNYPINEDYNSGLSDIVSSCSHSSNRLDTSISFDHF